MSEAKPKRRYDASRRQNQAAETLRAITEAAGRLFREKGWTATTMAAIAEAAGVSQETVYARFGNKAALARALIAGAMRGPEPGTPFMAQAGRRAVLDASSPEALVDAFAVDITAILVRVAPVLNMVRVAAESDPAMNQLYVDLQAARRQNLLGVAQRLNELGGLRVDLTVAAAGDVIWSLASPELFLLRTGPGLESPQSYTAWLSHMLRRLLLAE